MLILLCLTFSFAICLPSVSLNPNLLYSGWNGYAPQTYRSYQSPYYTQRTIANSHGPNLYTGVQQLNGPNYGLVLEPNYVNYYPAPLIRPVPSYPSISSIPSIPLIPNQIGAQWPARRSPLAYPYPYPTLNPVPVVQHGLGGVKITGPGIATHPGYRPPTQWTRLWPPMDDNYKHDPNTGVVSIGPEGPKTETPASTENPDTSTENTTEAPVEANPEENNEPNEEPKEEAKEEEPKEEAKDEESKEEDKEEE